MYDRPTDLRQALAQRHWQKVLDELQGQVWLGERAVMAWVLWSVLVDEQAILPSDYHPPDTQEPFTLEDLWRACQALAEGQCALPASLHTLMTELAATLRLTEPLHTHGWAALQLLPKQDPRRVGVVLYLTESLHALGQHERLAILLQQEVPSQPDLLPLLHSFVVNLPLVRLMGDGLPATSDAHLVLQLLAGQLSWRALPERPLATPLLCLTAAGSAMDEFWGRYRRGECVQMDDEEPRRASAFLVGPHENPVLLAGRCLQTALLCLLLEEGEPRRHLLWLLDRLANDPAEHVLPPAFQDAEWLLGLLLQAHADGHPFLRLYLDNYHLYLLGRGFNRPHRSVQRSPRHLATSTLSLAMAGQRAGDSLDCEIPLHRRQTTLSGR